VKKMVEEEYIDQVDVVKYRWYPSQEPWWVLLISGLLIGAFGIVLLASPLATTSFLVILFGIFAIIFGAIAFIRSFFLIKEDKYWWVLLIEGILGIAIGILVFVFPIETTVVLIYFIAAWLIVRGIFTIANGSSAKSGLTIAMGVVALILGIFVLFRPPAYAMATLLGFIGLFAIIRAITLIVQSIVIPIQRKNREKAGKV
jgi:uncharacterized membrane protein HdeD (DUF308 family)